MIKIITITISLFSCLFSQFIDVQITYEYNDRIIGNDKTYILEEFNSSIENYYKTTSFSNEYDYLDIPLKIHFIFERINFIGEHEFDQLLSKCLSQTMLTSIFMQKMFHSPIQKDNTFTTIQQHLTLLHHSLTIMLIYLLQLNLIPMIYI